MEKHDKILNRAELNQLKITEIDDMLKRYGLKKGLTVSIQSRQEKIDRLLGHYRHLFNTNGLYIQYKEETRGRKPKEFAVLSPDTVISPCS